MANDELIGTVFKENYEIKGKLGAGGMGTVYRAYQASLDRDVAIKVLPTHYSTDPQFIERFRIEARAMARLTHPNIVTVYDTGEWQGLFFIVMEYVPGGTIKQLIGKPMPPKDASLFIKQVASALHFAHEHGIIHRDVKPVNVLLGESLSEYRRAVLSDFGIAKMTQSNENLTVAGTGIGTPEYMSPEQGRGEKIDGRTDLYALGVMLYEMLAGRVPFQGANYMATLFMHLTEAPPPLRAPGRDISPAVEAVVMRALAKEKEQRFQTALEFSQALEEAVRIPAGVPISPPGPPPPAATIRCTNCGRENQAAKKFCGGCGKALFNPAAGPPAHTQTPPLPNDSGQPAQGTYGPPANSPQTGPAPYPTYQPQTGVPRQPYLPQQSGQNPYPPNQPPRVPGPNPQYPQRPYQPQQGPYPNQPQYRPGVTCVNPNCRTVNPTPNTGFCFRCRTRLPVSTTPTGQPVPTPQPGTGGNPPVNVPPGTSIPGVRVPATAGPVCPEGHPNAPGRKFCTKCGKPLSG